MRITILTNGPGELWGWVRPVASELRKRGHTISLWILPCQFASGHEREAASLLGVDKLEGPANASRIWRDIAEERTDRIIQLGGDIAFGLRMSEKTDAPLTCYTYGPRKFIQGAKTLTAYEAQAGDIPNVEAIGDLVKDAVAMDITPSGVSMWNWPKDASSPRILFLPGSRPAIRKPALSWLAEAHDALKARMPSVRVRTLFSQFMPESEFSSWQKAGLNPVRAGAGVAMREADYALTQPGTNNFELMHCGLPALVAAPEKFLRFVPVSGVLGILANIPLLGLKLRRIGTLRVIKRWGGYISLPNRIAPHKVMAEMWGDITPEDAAEEICERLADTEGLRKTREELLSLSGKSGAASRLCDIVTAQ
ncbi:MAG: cdisaccharide synthetase [Synergistaceae bacterium]|nr:cdisaccharide synthetase [Synergistaceae bacterium]